MVANLYRPFGAFNAPSQGASYYEKDGYYARDDPAHRDASAWVGKGADALGLSGPVDPDAFRAVLEGKVPDGRQLGRRDRDGNIRHRSGRDVTLSAPKSVSLMAMVGGDDRVTGAHDRAVGRTLDWVEKNAIETRMRDPATGSMVRAEDQKMVAATFRHDTLRNLDPQLHTHCVIANMVQGGDCKWRTMVDDGLFRGKMASLGPAGEPFQSPVHAFVRGFVPRRQVPGHCPGDPLEQVVVDLQLQPIEFGGDSGLGPVQRGLDRLDRGFHIPVESRDRRCNLASRRPFRGRRPVDPLEDRFAPGDDRLPGHGLSLPGRDRLPQPVEVPGNRIHCRLELRKRGRIGGRPLVRQTRKWVRPVSRSAIVAASRGHRLSLPLRLSSE